MTTGADDVTVVAVPEREVEVLSATDQAVVVIELPAEAPAGAENQAVEVHVEAPPHTVATETQDVLVLWAGSQGPPGPPSKGGSGGGIFIQDVTGVGGIVGQKEWHDTIPAQANLAKATSDTATVRVTVGVAGGADSYSPEVLINGIPATLQESTTKRWFTGYADVSLVEGDNEIVAEVVGGPKDTALLFLAGPGPEILGITFGDYPGVQTELKAGDVLQVEISTETDAVEVEVLTGEAAASPVTLYPVAGIARGGITISGTNGNQGIKARAKNSLGTFGNTYSSPAVLVLNQTKPVIGAVSVTYPAGQQALGAGEIGTISATVSSFDTISYSSPDLGILLPDLYEPTKEVTNQRTGYVGSGANLAITATRAANNSTTTRTGLVKIATTPPKAGISIAGNPSRLMSSPAGMDYEVRITPDQTLAQAPGLNASAGVWVGAWTLSGAYWKRTLRISDSTARGVANFTNLSMVGLSGIPGDEITSGAGYVVGGMATREITFPAFSRVGFLGAPVGDPAKTSAQVSGGSILARQASNAVVANGYFIANADGSYNPNGSYVGLSDTAFAGANTSGSLVVIFAEAA